jgi:hypothetical protein
VLKKTNKFQHIHRSMELVRIIYCIIFFLLPSTFESLEHDVYSIFLSLFKELSYRLSFASLDSFVLIYKLYFYFVRVCKYSLNQTSYFSIREELKDVIFIFITLFRHVRQVLLQICFLDHKKLAQYRSNLFQNFFK